MRVGFLTSTLILVLSWSLGLNKTSVLLWRSLRFICSFTATSFESNVIHFRI